jgi:hypothetical protein
MWPDLLKRRNASMPCKKAWFSDSLYILRAVHVKKRHPARLKGWGYFTRWVNRLMRPTDNPLQRLRVFLLILMRNQETKIQLIKPYFSYIIYIVKLEAII